jgi:DNA-binding CsgD family transcriptional regulator
MQTFSISDPSGTSFEAYAQVIMEIVGFGQIHCKQTEGIGEKLCQEVMSATEGKARLRLHCHVSSGQQQAPFPISVSFQVQFNNRSYGTLDIASDPKHSSSPALPLPVAQLLAHICGLLLCTIELSVFIAGQYQRLDCQDPGQLTKREREVLGLICRGYSQQTITTMLNIMPTTLDTHRKRISEKLGVHCERDIPLAAYRASLFSILEEPNSD